MFHLGGWEEWESGVRRVGIFLKVGVSEDHRWLVNPTVLGKFAGYTTKDSWGNGAKKKLPQRHLNLIGGCINSYSVILDYYERLNMLKKSKKNVSSPGGY